MCSIFGAVGPSIDPELLSILQRAAGDRGRDGGNMVRYRLNPSVEAFVGNWRATPTTEVQSGRLQPYDGIVHNGTIANDDELGIRPGEIDSEILPRVLDRDGLWAFRDSVLRLHGSFAIAVVSEKMETVYLAANYKPIYYWSPDGRNTYFSSMARHFANVCPRGQAPVKVVPYTVMDLRSGQVLPLKVQWNNSALVVCSGGLDSTVVAAKLVADGFRTRLLHFQYGCIAEEREVERIPRIAHALARDGHREVDYAILDLDYGPMKGGSPLLDPTVEIDHTRGGVTGAEYANEWVPARNLVMLAHAIAYGEANGFHTVALGNNLEEAGAYPDNEEEFTTLLNTLLPNATQNGYAMQILSPVGHLMKHEIVSLGLAIDAPFGLTWSCYNDGEFHCGKCGPCFMRREAFRRNGVIDPTAIDPHSSYWRDCIQLTR